MSGTAPTGKETLSPQQMRRLDELCTRFEAAWKAGQPPRIRDYLGESPEAERAALLQELIELDVEYRHRRGEEPKAQEYFGHSATLDQKWLAGVFPRRPAAEEAAIPSAAEAAPTLAATANAASPPTSSQAP